MNGFIPRMMFVTVLMLIHATLARAQGTSTASLSGTVVDSAGAVIPGATISLQSKGGGTPFTTVTNETGEFSVPSLDAGKYKVTVTLMGFKTAVLDDIELQPGVPASVKATLEVGGLEETVVVHGAADLVNTQTATVSATLNVDQINRMPLPTRNALNAVTFLPGVSTTGTNRQSSVNGLPDSFVHITLDGVSNSDNFNKSTDGFFASITPRQDAVEAVTVTSAAGGSDVGGHGAIAIHFVTRSGSNRSTGSAYEYWRSPQLNSNYWFNERNGLPKNDVRLNQYGFREGGPIVLPRLFDGHNKAFFFVNYEELRLPNNFTRTRRVLQPRAQQGWFRYNATVNGEQIVREVNVLDLAQANDQLASVDPLVSRILGYINADMGRGRLNATSDPLINNFVWQSPGNQVEKQPVVRIDYNLSTNHRLSGTFNQLSIVRDPDHLNNEDRRFPGASNYGKYDSTRPSRSLALRSTLGPNLVSELRGGATVGGVSYFGRPSSDSPNGIPTFDDTHGYAINLDGSTTRANALVTDWYVRNTPSWRSAYTYNIDENLTWQKTRHTITMGGALFFGRAWENGQQMVPTINLGFNTAEDPAAGLFTTANFPGASGAQLTEARKLYALLTGRVTSITGQAALSEATNRYVAFGPRRRAGQMNEYSLFAQDSWRMTPTVTLTGGLRWDVQLPFSPVNDIMSTASLEDVCGVSGLGPGYDSLTACNFFQPAPTDPNARTPEFAQFKRGGQGYETQWANLAPHIGVAWRPDVQSGWLRALLGDPEQATLRGGYSVAYDRQGMGRFTGAFGANPGSTLSLTRNESTGLVGPDESWPVLLRESDRLYNAPFPQTPSFPIPIRANRADSINAFHPNINIASARSWNVSFERALSSNTAVEVRYVGTRGVNLWTELNYNERNLIENGFFDEFKAAMENLQANNASGRTDRAGSFAYFGPGTGTNPLPTYLAYLVGSTDANNPAAYAGGTNTWRNTALAQRLVRTNPNPHGSADDLDGNLTRRRNALAAGLPANFFVVNPDANNVNVWNSDAYSTFHALQIEMRRRLSRGLYFAGSYQYAREASTTHGNNPDPSFAGFHYGRVLDPTAGVRHAIKTQWDWAVPVGHGERFGGSLPPVLNAVLGGWQFNGVGRIQARMENFGNVRLVGMTEDDLQKMYKFDVRIDPVTGLRTVYMLPDDVILNTRRAFSVNTTSPTGYSDLGVPQGRYVAPASGPDCIELAEGGGDCAPRRLLIRAPFFTRFDIGVTKRIPIHGSTSIELRADVLNVLNNIDFNPVANPGSGATIFQTNGAYQDLNNTFDPGGRLGQLVFRLNW